MSLQLFGHPFSFDGHLMGPMQSIVFDACRPEDARDPTSNGNRATGQRRASSAPFLTVSRRPEPHSVRSTPGSTMPWRGENGQPVMLSRWPTLPPRLRCSTLTGRTRSAKIALHSGPIAHACLRVPRLPAASTTPVPIGASSHSELLIGTDT